MASLIGGLVLVMVGVVSALNDTDLPNYFVDFYEGGISYAYPMDVCLTNGVLSSDDIIYTCSEDGTYVTKTIYKNSACTNVKSATNYTAENVTEEGLYEFNCGGINSYVEFYLCPVVNSLCDLSAGGTCDDQCGCFLPTTVYAVTDVCIYAGNGSTIVSSYGTCNNTMMQITSYTGSLTCDESEATNTSVLSAASECALFYVTESTLGTANVYAELSGCYVDVTPAPTMQPTMQPTAVPGSSDQASSSMKPFMAFMVAILGYFNL